LEPETTNIRALTPPLTCAPARVPASMRTSTTAHAPFAAHYRYPRRLLQRTHRRYHRQQHHAPFPMSCLLPRVTCSITTTPHLEHHLACQSPIKLPHHLPQLPSQAKHTLDKIPSAKLQANPFSTPWPLRSQCLVILGLKTVVHGS
jgi:hypothetical protein